MTRIKVPLDLNDVGYSLYKTEFLNIKPGVTILVGCNGAGKTTLLRSVKHYLKEKNILYVSYDNLNDGGSNSASSNLFYGNISTFASLFCSSEGEGIVINLIDFLKRLGRFASTGSTEDLLSKSDKFDRLMASMGKEQPELKTDEIWVILDASDSGLSVDNVVDVKMVLNHIVKRLEGTGKKVYVLIACNEYEMTVNEKCLVLPDLEYRTFDSYEAYRECVIESRKYKDMMQEQAQKESKDSEDDDDE